MLSTSMTNSLPSSNCSLVMYETWLQLSGNVPIMQAVSQKAGFMGRRTAEINNATQYEGWRLAQLVERRSGCQSSPTGPGSILGPCLCNFRSATSGNRKWEYSPIPEISRHPTQLSFGHLFKKRVRKHSVIKVLWYDYGVLFNWRLLAIISDSKSWNGPLTIM